MTREAAVAVWSVEGVRRVGRGIGVQAERGVCPHGLIGDRLPPVNLPNPPKSHW